MLKKYLGYLPFAALFGFLLLMQFTSYEKVDQLPLLNGDGIKWTSDNLEESLTKAKQQDKLIFVDFYAKWCRPCKMLKSVTFPRESVGKLFNENFINLSIDVDSPEGSIIANKYQITSYPTLLILDTNGSEVSRKVGFVIPLQLTNWGKEQLQSLEAKPIFRISQTSSSLLSESMVALNNFNSKCLEILLKMK